MYEDRNGVHGTRQYDSDMKKDDIIPFPVTRKKLEIIILSVVRDKDKYKVLLPVESKQINFYKNETVS